MIFCGLTVLAVALYLGCELIADAIKTLRPENIYVHFDKPKREADNDAA